MPPDNDTPLTDLEAETRENVRRIFDQCRALLASVEPLIQVARDTIDFVDRQTAELKPLIDNLGIHAGPLSETRDRLAALLK